MKKCKFYTVVFVVMLIMGGFLHVSSSRDNWQKEACEVDASCEILSNKFTEPYCVNLSIPVDHVLDCLRQSVANELSSFRNSDGSISIENFEMRDVLHQYCKSLLGDGNFGRIYFARPSNINSKNWDWQQTFDSHQSIFVYALCSSFKGEDEEDGDDMPFVKNSDYSEEFISKVFTGEDLAKLLKLQQKSRGKDLCSFSAPDNYSIIDCDMTVYATEIFSAIMSDVFKIKYAQVLDVNDVNNFDSEEKVVQFMSGYFHYNKEEFKDLKEEFPQTIDVIQSNQKYYKKVLETVKILNNSELVDIASDTKCPVDGNMKGVDFVACALHSSQGNGSSLTPSFLTLVYNEIINYGVFELYMNAWIEEKTKSMSKSEKDKYLKKSLDFQGYASMQVEAAKQAMLGFEDFNMTYPMHIGLLLYQEKVRRFRDLTLSPIVTLFYSLSEKLQNVQLPN